jgi:prefoldin subunit 5
VPGAMSGVAHYRREEKPLALAEELRAKNAQIELLQAEIRRLTLENQQYRSRTARDKRDERWFKRD